MLWNNDFPLKCTLTYRKEVLDDDNLEILWKYFPFSISPRISGLAPLSCAPVSRASVSFSSDRTELLQTLPRHQALSLAEGVEGREGEGGWRSSVEPTLPIARLLCFPYSKLYCLR